MNITKTTPEDTIDHASTRALGVFRNYFAAFFYCDRAQEMVITDSQVGAPECAYNGALHSREYNKKLSPEEAAQFKAFRDGIAQKLFNLAGRFESCPGENTEQRRARHWQVIDSMVKSAPVLTMLSILVTTPPEHAEGEVLRLQQALFMTVSAAVFPTLFNDVEQINSIKWLAHVRDFQELSEEQKSSFLDQLWTMFGRETDSEDWQKKKEFFLETTARNPSLELPAGLFPFRDWPKLRDISLEKFEVYKADLNTRFLFASVVMYLPGCQWASFVDEDGCEDSPLKRARDIMDRSVKEAEEIVRQSEEKRRERQAAQKKLNDTLKAAEEEKKAENAARALAQVREFNSKPQPVPIPADSEKLIKNFDKCNPGSKSAAEESKKKFLDAVALLRESDFFLDYRGRARDKKGDPAIRELAEVLLSTTNLTIVANALGNDTDKHFKPYFVPERTPVLQSAEELGKLYAESDAVRDQVDQILTEPEVAIFVAAVVLPIVEVSGFVSFIGSKASSEEKNRRLGEFSERIKNALNHYDDIRTVKSLRVYENGKDSGSKSKTFDTEIPDWVNQNIGAACTCFADQENGYVYVYLNEDPVIFFEVPKSELKSEDKFRKFFTQELAKAYQTKEYSGLLKELKELGFQVEIEAEQTRISHIKCGIDQTFSGAVYEIKRLRELKEDFEESQGRAEALKERMS